MSDSKIDFNAISDDMITIPRLAGNNLLTIFLAGFGITG